MNAYRDIEAHDPSMMNVGKTVVYFYLKGSKIPMVRTFFHGAWYSSNESKAYRASHTFHNVKEAWAKLNLVTVKSTKTEGIMVPHSEIELIRAKEEDYFVRTPTCKDEDIEERDE